MSKTTLNRNDYQLYGYYNDTKGISNGYTPKTGKEEKVLNVNVFFKAGFIDTWGRGFQKIRNGFEAEGIPMPKVENFCGGVQVSIERTNFIKMSHVVSDVGSFVGS